MMVSRLVVPLSRLSFSGRWRPAGRSAIAIPGCSVTLSADCIADGEQGLLRNQP
jgi:hypothetical protein